MFDLSFTPAKQLFLCFVLFITLIFYSASQPACFPWEDEPWQQPLTCRNETTSNPTYQYQTISDMTARTGTTAELLSGLAAAMLLSIYNALRHIKKQATEPNANDKIDWNLVMATYGVGAVGFIGLTVWNLRVQSTVHTCFTSQTIVAVYVQIFTLTANENLVVQRITKGLFLVAGGIYVGGFMYVEKPPPVPSEYFKWKYHWFVLGQYFFFDTALLSL